MELLGCPVLALARRMLRWQEQHGGNLCRFNYNSLLVGPS